MASLLRQRVLAASSSRCFSTAAAPASSRGARLAALREALSEEASLTLSTASEKRVRRKQVEPKPDWLRVAKPGGAEYNRIRKGLRGSKLASVCEEAKCPNIGECWGGKKGTATATIMVMGDTCTRGCRFCNVKTSRTPPELDPLEAAHTAENIASWGVDYVVITSVDRDDIPDGGAGHFAEVVRRAKAIRSSLLLECLTPDFNGTSGLDGVATVATSGLDVYAHNIETVERLQSTVRDRRAGYAESIAVLEHAKKVAPKLVTKTSIMLGHGEEDAEVRQTMRDMLNAGVEIFTLGQYLRPTKRHIPVARMVPPAEYEAWRKEGMSMGFKYVASGPLVRSSYKAGEVFLEAFVKERQKNGEAPLAGVAREGEWRPPIDGTERRREPGAGPTKINLPPMEEKTSPMMNFV